MRATWTVQLSRLYKMVAVQYLPQDQPSYVSTHDQRPSVIVCTGERQTGDLFLKRDDGLLVVTLSTVYMDDTLICLSGEDMGGIYGEAVWFDRALFKAGSQGRVGLIFV